MANIRSRLGQGYAQERKDNAERNDNAGRKGNAERKTNTGR
jgi:hypothetical protein